MPSSLSYMEVAGMKYLVLFFVGLFTWQASEIYRCRYCRQIQVGKNHLMKHVMGVE